MAATAPQQIACWNLATVPSNSSSAPMVLRIGSASPQPGCSPGKAASAGGTAPNSAQTATALKDLPQPTSDAAYAGFLPPSPWDGQKPARPGSPEAILRIKQAVKLMTGLKLKPGQPQYAHRNKGGNLWGGRYCWHWAWMVYRYANMHYRQGQNRESDKEGPYGRKLGAGRSRREVAPRGFHGLKRDQFLIKKEADTRVARKRYRTYRGKFLADTSEGVGPSVYDQILPGDWLYIFNNNSSVGGSHSVIFLHWGGTYLGKTYDAAEGRKQLIFTEASQYTPWRGGKIVSHQFNERWRLTYIHR